MRSSSSSERREEEDALLLVLVLVASPPRLAEGGTNMWRRRRRRFCCVVVVVANAFDTAIFGASLPLLPAAVAGRAPAHGAGRRARMLMLLLCRKRNEERAV